MVSILKQELIGATVRVSNARNRTLIGLTGIIIDETKHMIIIKTEKGAKRLIKDAVTLEFPNQRVRVKGNLFLGRPEERIKKISR